MDPLKDLQDIALSEPIHNYPIAIGWWLLLAITLVLMVLFYKKHQANKKRDKAKKQALAQLAAQQNSVTEMMKTLKWVTLAYFPREQVASLFGEDYLAFLKNCLKEGEQEPFYQKIKPAFDAQYQENISIDNNEIYQSISLWINRALPPKPRGEHD